MTAATEQTAAHIQEGIMPTTVPLSAPTSPPTPVSPDEAQPQEYLLERAGDRDLAFSGWLIGFGEQKTEPRYTSADLRGVTVSIYATDSDNLVIHSCRWEKREDKERTSDCEVVAFTEWSTEANADAALKWLIKDAGGKLGPTSKSAWEQACENWSKLASKKVERI